MSVPAERIQQTQDPPADPTGMVQMIERFATNPDVDVHKLEKLLDMQERVLNRNAEAAFNTAMKAVQEELPRIKRDKRNDQTNSNYATLEALNKAIVPIYTRHGFSLSFGSADCPVADHIRINCLVSHVCGHSRPYQCDVPNDLAGMKGTPNKTKTHAFGSTMSYGRRYLTLLIFNLSMTDEDNDGNGAGLPRVSEEQAANLHALIDEVKADKHAFLRYFKADSIETLAAQAYNDAVRMLEQKRKAAPKVGK